MEFTKEDKKKIKELFEVLYFQEGLEDIKALHYLKRDSINKWCENQGKKLASIMFALALEGDIVRDKFVKNKGNKLKNDKQR